MNPIIKKLLLTSALLLLVPYRACSTDIKKVLKTYKESVVLIKTDRGTGTGFFINSCGTIVTCYHVIHQAKKVQVRWGKRFIPAEVIVREKKYDQALLNIHEQNTPYLPVQPHIVRRIPNRLMKKSDSIFVMGFPFAADKVSVNQGKIRDIFYKYEDMEGVIISGIIENIVYQTDMEVYPGNSGSPVFDKEGHVIGMAAARADIPKKKRVAPKSFAVSLDKLLSRKEILFQSVGFRKGEVILFKETEHCRGNTNPYYFRYADCHKDKDMADKFYYECPNISCGNVGYKGAFAGSFMGIPLYESCRPDIIPRHFSRYTYSRRFYAFLQRLVSNPELKKLLVPKE